jgi:hypothetical protein
LTKLFLQGTLKLDSPSQAAPLPSGGGGALPSQTVEALPLRPPPDAGGGGGALHVKGHRDGEGSMAAHHGRWWGEGWGHRVVLPGRPRLMHYGGQR